jgi:glycosyltransferase involved in cell wall biosynthesis
VRAHQQSLARCDRLSAYHPSSHEELIRYGIPEKQVSLFPPAVRFWNQNLPQEAARKHLGLPPDSPILFCASRFPDVDEPDSGKVQMLFDLISASSSLPGEAILLIAGDGPGKAALEQAISSVPKLCSIRLVGAVDHDTMPLYFAACDFFVYPTSVDRPWLSVLEAQSCGRPVVTMRSRSSQLTVQDGKTGLLATDLNDFRQAISTLAMNRHSTREMGHAAAEFIAEHHSLKRRIDQIESILDGSPDEPVMNSSTSSARVSDGTDFGC